MGEIVNLRRDEEAPGRDQRPRWRNRIGFATAATKAEQANDKRAEERRQALLDASRRGETSE